MTSQPHEHASDVPAPEMSPALIRLIASASVEIVAKNEAAAERWHLSDEGRWAVDFDLGSISFTFADHFIVGPVQMIGSYSEKTASFMWGWGHRKVPDRVLATARATRAYGVEHSLMALTTRLLAVPFERVAWDLACVAVQITGAAALYRAPEPETRRYRYFALTNDFVTTTFD